MRTADRAISITLFVTSAVAIVAGIVIIVLGHTWTRDRVETSSKLLSANLETAEAVARTLQTESDELENIVGLSAEAADAAEHLPTLLQESSDLMRATNETIRRSAGSLRAFEGSADFLTSGSPISQTADSLMRLAERLETLRRTLLETRQPVGSLVEQLQLAAAAQQTLRRSLAEDGLSLDVVIERLERTRKLRQRADLAAAAAWQQTAAGAGFLLLGILLGGIGMIWHRLLPEPDS